MFSYITGLLNPPAKSPSSSQILHKIQLEEYGTNLATDLDNLTKNINNRHKEYLSSDILGDALTKIKNEEQINYIEKIHEKEKNNELQTYVGDKESIANNFTKIMDEKYNYLFYYFVNYLFEYISDCKTKNGDNILIYMIKNFNDKEKFNQNKIIEIINKIIIDKEKGKEEEYKEKIKSFIDDDALSLAISNNFLELSNFLITKFPGDYSKSCNHLKIFKEKLKTIKDITFYNLKLDYNDLYEDMKCNYHEKKGGSNKKQKSKHHKKKKLGKKSKRKTRK
jgi:hypothetical protein